MTLATLPAIAGALFFFLLKRPGADLSGLVLRAGVLTSVTAVVVLELLSIPSAATRLALVLVWVVVVLALAAVLVLRWRRGGSEIPADAHPRQWWSVVRARAGQVYAYEWVAVVAMAAFALVELILGQVWLPNTQDSMTYHLARLEHWRLNDSIYPYASIIYRQVTYAPGGEYLSFTLRVLGDTIWATPLMQWASALACGIVAYRIARQLGCGRAGRMLAAVLTLTAPALVVQASGTSNDLIAGFFLLGFASLVLEFRDGKGSWWLAAITGITLGMAVLTKSTTIPLAAGFGLWWVWILVRQRLDGVK
ncbi:ArnT family glycosyltransferase, partial [Fodinicola feengrottensis]